VIKRDEGQVFPAAQIVKLAGLGFMGMIVDSKYGSAASMDTVSYTLGIGKITNCETVKYSIPAIGAQM